MITGPYMVEPPDFEFPDAGTRYMQLQQQLALTTEAQAHAVLLHHDKVAGVLTKRYDELLGKMGEVEKELTQET